MFFLRSKMRKMGVAFLNRCCASWEGGRGVGSDDGLGTREQPWSVERGKGNDWTQCNKNVCDVAAKGNTSST
jgi:hypothetical protein